MTDPLLGKTLKDAYRIESQLADGGMGMVYVAEQLSLHRKVVLKVLRPEFYDQAFVDLFLREARINSQINHPNIVSVFDFGTAEENIVFLAMELLQGQALGDVVNEGGPFNLARIVWLMEQLCNGLFAAHQLDIVHRDLKPNNIMIARLSGDTTVAKVLDFGISKPLKEDDLEHTQMGMVMGTPGYLSPEQIEGGLNLDHRSDIYALGALLFFMATGKRPFNGINREVIMRQQLSGDIPELDLENCPSQDCLCLNPVIKKAMALDKQQRYSDVKMLWQDLLAHAEAHQKIQQGNTEPSPTEIANAQFQVVFKGQVAKGESSETVKSRLKKTLKLEQQQVDVLFSGKRIIIRRNLSKKDAERFVKVFKASGAEAHLQAQNDLTQIQPQGKAGSGQGSQPTPLPTAGLVQPVTLTSIQTVAGDFAVKKSPSRESDSNTSTDISSNSNASKTTSKPLLGVIVTCVLLAMVVLGSTTYFYKPLRYSLQDKWMVAVNDFQTPQGVTSDTVKVGMSAAFSGSARELGRSMRLGIEAYFKKINKNGGIHGRSLELVALDDGYEPSRAKSNLEKLFDDDSGVFSLLGNVGTPTAEVIVPLAFEERMLVFGTFSGARLLRNDPPDRYVFNYRASYAEETAAIIHYFVTVKKISPKKIAVFYQHDGYGKDGLSGVITALDHYEVYLGETLSASYQRNSTNIRSGVEAFVPFIDEIDAIVIVGTYAASAEFTRAMVRIGYKGEFANVSFVGTQALAEAIKESGVDLLNNILVTQTVPLYSSHGSLALDYQDALAEFYPEESADFISLEGYVIAKLYCEGLRRAGRYFSMDTVIDSLESIKDLDIGIGSPLSFSKSDHQASHRVWGSQINAQGEIEALDLEKAAIP